MEQSSSTLLLHVAAQLKSAIMEVPDLQKKIWEIKAHDTFYIQEEDWVRVFHLGGIEQKIPLVGIPTNVNVSGKTLIVQSGTIFGETISEDILKKPDMFFRSFQNKNIEIEEVSPVVVTQLLGIV